MIKTRKFFGKVIEAYKEVARVKHSEITRFSNEV